MLTKCHVYPPRPFRNRKNKAKNERDNYQYQYVLHALRIALTYPCNFVAREDLNYENILQGQKEKSHE